MLSLRACKHRRRAIYSRKTQVSFFLFPLASLADSPPTVGPLCTRGVLRSAGGKEGGALSQCQPRRPRLLQCGRTPSCGFAVKRNTDQSMLCPKNRSLLFTVVHGNATGRAIQQQSTMIVLSYNPVSHRSIVAMDQPHEMRLRDLVQQFLAVCLADSYERVELDVMLTTQATCSAFHMG